MCKQEFSKATSSRYDQVSILKRKRFRILHTTFSFSQGATKRSGDLSRETSSSQRKAMQAMQFSILSDLHQQTIELEEPDPVCRNGPVVLVTSR